MPRDARQPIAIRLSRAERAAMQRAARRAGLPLTTWLRQVATTTAKAANAAAREAQRARHPIPAEAA